MSECLEFLEWVVDIQWESSGNIFCIYVECGIVWHGLGHLIFWNFCERKVSEKVFCIYLEFGIVWHGHSYEGGIIQIFRNFWNLFWCKEKCLKKDFAFILYLTVFGMVILMRKQSSRFLEFFGIYFGVQRKVSENIFRIYLCHSDIFGMPPRNAIRWVPYCLEHFPYFMCYRQVTIPY